MKSYVFACIGVPLAIIFFIVSLTFMTIADDLSKRVDKQESYILQLEQELKNTELICLGYSNDWLVNYDYSSRDYSSDIRDK